MLTYMTLGIQMVCERNESLLYYAFGLPKLTNRPQAGYSTKQ